MSNVEKAFIDKLLAASGVTNLLGSRIYNSQAPQTPDPAFAVLSVVSKQRTYSINAADNILVKARFQLDIWAKTATLMREIGDATRAAINGFRGEHSGVNFQAVLLLDELRSQSETAEMHSLTQDFRVWYHE